MQEIAPCLWFDNDAEEAVSFYTAVFKNSKVGNISRYGEAGHEIHGKPAGTVLTIEFELDGQAFTALNGGPVFKFSEAISFQIYCESQEEVDEYWGKFSAGGDKQAQRCGWLKDKYGVSWQIVPTVLGKMLQDNDAARANRVMQALLQMTKIDTKVLSGRTKNHEKSSSESSIAVEATKRPLVRTKAIPKGCHAQTPGGRRCGMAQATLRTSDKGVEEARGGHGGFRREGMTLATHGGFLHRLW